jgi:hypothetical protein
MTVQHSNTQRDDIHSHGAQPRYNPFDDANALQRVRNATQPDSLFLASLITLLTGFIMI